jgi:hypothetical protein
LTIALWTPGTLWMASVTCRTQLLQVIPSMRNSETAEPEAGLVLAVAGSVTFMTRAKMQCNLKRCNASRTMSTGEFALANACSARHRSNLRVRG